MFALEIDFHDGISRPDTILVRRPNAIIGSSNFAHVAIEGAASGNYELRIVRGLGRQFQCLPVRKSESSRSPSFLEGVYDGHAEVSLGSVSVQITSLDIDLIVASDLPTEQESIRVMRDALRSSSPTFPAVALVGSIPIFISFRESEPLTIGRAKGCGLRIDASDVSSNHARIGVSEGEFWIEDLGSTNGTFIDGRRVAGRQIVACENSVTIGAKSIVRVVATESDIANLNMPATVSATVVDAEERYPCLITNSEFVQPKRYVLPQGSQISVGRDPASDIWIGAAHVSRNHAAFSVSELGVAVRDQSSNGIFLDGERLPQNEFHQLESSLNVLDLSAGIFLGVCYGKEDEDLFKEYVENKLSSEKAERKTVETTSSESIWGVETQTTTQPRMGTISPMTDKNDAIGRDIRDSSTGRKPTVVFSSFSESGLENAASKSIDSSVLGGENAGFHEDPFFMEEPQVKGFKRIAIYSSVFILLAFVLLALIWLFAESFL